MDLPSPAVTEARLPSHATLALPPLALLRPTIFFRIEPLAAVYLSRQQQPLSGKSNRD